MRRRDKNNTVLLQSAAQEFTGFQQGKNHPPSKKKKEGMNRLCNGTEIIVRYLNAVHHFELYKPQ
jgi:hypothetical protein